MSRLCSLEGCDKPHDSGGLCGMHAQRVRRYGDANFVTSNEQFRVNCRIAAVAYKPARPDVYRKLHNRHEHRVVMEKMLGRKLSPDEVVHHVDGNKHNNVTQNLQVMSRSEHLKVHRAEMQVAKQAKQNAIKTTSN